MQAGELRQLVGFYKRVEVDDGAGNSVADFGLAPEFTAAAAIVPRLGGEAILAGRLEGKNAVNITVRYSPRTATVTTDWKAKDMDTEAEYNIRSIINPDRRKIFLEMLAEEGVAT